MTRALIVAAATDKKRQVRLATYAEERGYELAGVIADAGEAWAAAVGGTADVVLVEHDGEVPEPLTPRFVSVEAERRKAADRRRRRPGTRRPEVLPR